jgi:peptidoglycan hydrolase CwlO-like protein
MENKILDRITELSNNINDLLTKREELIQELKKIEKNIEIMHHSIHELKNILPENNIVNPQDSNKIIQN